jgi:oligopeptide transport system ATP-binding protein
VTADSASVASAANGHGDGELLLRAEHVKKYFPIRTGILLQREVARVHAVDDVSIDLRAGETLGLVGESGCGKSTLARCIARLFPLTAGSVVFEGQDISRLSRRKLRPVRRELQLVFQDPYASLNPRKRVGEILSNPLRIHKYGNRGEIKRRVRELLELVGLSPEHINRYPHEFSGGQRQRIGVARALALHPKLIIADEPVSALDVSIRAQVINLLDDLQDELHLTYIFIAHDLGVVRHVSDRIAVMYLGKIVEVSPAEELYQRPIHPYTEALLSAVPIPDPDLSDRRAQIVLEGDVPSPILPPSGCRFHPRCRYATKICAEQEPPLTGYGGDSHLAACHHPLNLGLPAAPAAAAETLPAAVAEVPAEETQLAARPLHVPLGELPAPALGVERHHEAVVVDLFHRAARSGQIGTASGRHRDVSIHGDGPVRSVIGARLVPARGAGGRVLA